MIGWPGWAEASPATIRNFFIKNGDSKTADLSAPDRHNNPLDWGFSANFELVSPQYNEFMFSTGDCTEWITAKRTEIERFKTENGEFELNFDATYLNPLGTSVKVSPVSSDSKNPLITPVDYDHSDAQSLAIYSEDAEIDHQNMVSPKGGVNVFVRRRWVDLTKWTEWSQCDVSCGRGTKSRTREVRTSGVK